MFPYCCLLITFIIVNHSMFSFQGTSLNLFFKKLNEDADHSASSVNFLWWRVPGSNRWPPACKAGALPAELTPHKRLFEVVGQNGLEPPTSRLSVVCSSQLSYWPVYLVSSDISNWMVEISGIEPLTSCLQGRRSPSWAKPPYRRNQIHNLRIYLFKLNARLCLCFSSSRQTRFAGLCREPFFIFRSGGPKWTRTIDLTIISRVL